MHTNAPPTHPPVTQPFMLCAMCQCIYTGMPTRQVPKLRLTRPLEGGLTVHILAGKAAPTPKQCDQAGCLLGINCFSTAPARQVGISAGP